MSLRTDPNILVDKKFIGIPYKFHGTKPETGMDCIGLMILYVKETFGIEMKYDDNRGPIMENWYVDSPGRFVDAFMNHGRALNWASLRKNDVPLFYGETVVNRYPTCLGIMIDDRHFLTTMEDRGSFVSILNEHWKRIFWGGIRLHKFVEAGLSKWP